MFELYQYTCVRESGLSSLSLLNYMNRPIFINYHIYTCIFKCGQSIILRLLVEELMKSENFELTLIVKGKKVGSDVKYRNAMHLHRE